VISIGNTLNELDRSHRLSEAAMDSYTAALRNMAQYAVEIDSSLTAPHRQNLNALADRVASGKVEAIEESRSTLRGLLREYRDSASRFLNGLREELASTARALEEILDSLAQSDGDHETRLRNAVRQVREAAADNSSAAIRAVILPAAQTIEDCLEKIRAQHQLTIAQFQAEIRMLHQRIDTLETAVALDQMSALLNRAAIEERVRETVPPFCILMLRVQGIRVAEARYSRDVAAECAAAFGKRLRNGLPLDAIVGRWGQEEFVAILRIQRPEVMKTAKWAIETLCGPYSCIHNGKAVHPRLQVSAAAMEGGDSPGNLLLRLSEFLGAGGS